MKKHLSVPDCRLQIKLHLSLASFVWSRTKCSGPHLRICPEKAMIQSSRERRADNMPGQDVCHHCEDPCRWRRDQSCRSTSKGYWSGQGRRVRGCHAGVEDQGSARSHCSSRHGVFPHFSLRVTLRRRAACNFRACHVGSWNWQLCVFADKARRHSHQLGVVELHHDFVTNLLGREACVDLLLGLAPAAAMHIKPDLERKIDGLCLLGQEFQRQKGGFY